MSLPPLHKTPFLTKLSQMRGQYPRQFWLLFYGMLLNVMGVSMVWPFLTIYISEQLDLPLTAVAGLITLNSIATLLFSFIAGPISDRVGRKGLMVFALMASGVSYLLLGFAQTYLSFVILMLLRGAATPLFSVPADAMLADLLPAEKRPDGYSLLRMSKNLGISVGPAVGGLITATSYTLGFGIAAAAQVTFSLLILILARETLQKSQISDQPRPKPRLHLTTAGYGKILRDRVFMRFTAGITLNQVGAALVWVLLAVYAKENFGVPESQFGLIAATNAILVVTLQLLVTQFTKRRPVYHMLALGALIYALGTGSVVLGQGFWGFWMSMVIITFGELVLVPTADTHAANLAPAEKRGRYLSVYQLSWSLAAGIGPIFGGLLNDSLGPRYIWIGGMLVGLLGAAMLAGMARQARKASQQEAATPGFINRP
jgi:MFS family permease